RFGDQHRHGMRKRASGLNEKLQRIGERERIASIRLNDREYLLEIAAVQIGLENGLPRMHPIHVAFDGVDLAVMRDVAERMRQLPRGKRNGGKSLMDEAERAGDIGIRQFAVEIRDLRSEQQALVYDGPSRERRDGKHL